MNITDAKARLDELALDAENANYHSEAGAIWNTIIPALDTLTETTWVYVIIEGETHLVEVTV